MMPSRTARAAGPCIRGRLGMFVPDQSIGLGQQLGLACFVQLLGLAGLVKAVDGLQEPVPARRHFPRVSSGFPG